MQLTTAVVGDGAGSTVTTNAADTTYATASTSYATVLAGLTPGDDLTVQGLAGSVPDLAADLTNFGYVSAVTLVLR